MSKDYCPFCKTKLKLSKEGETWYYVKAYETEDGEGFYVCESCGKDFDEPITE